ncbi:YybH family protein [Bacteroidota bacterium]
MKINQFFLLFLLIIISGNSFCQAPKQNDLVKEIMNMEKAFSDSSVKYGFVRAFEIFIDDECTVLSAHHPPIVGKKNVLMHIEKSFPPTAMNPVMSWEVSHVEISRSRDMAYTYGIYTLRVSEPEDTPKMEKGTFVTIWKKNEDSDWKVVFDSGQPGLEPKEEEK